jgi:hypothetical protein
LRTLERAIPHREEKDATKIVRMLPHVADQLCERVRGGNLGLRDLHSIIEGRNVLFGIFGGKVTLRPAPVQGGKRPFLIARVGINRDILLEAAADAAGCVKSGSGGSIRSLLARLPRRVSR